MYSPPISKFVKSKLDKVKHIGYLRDALVFIAFALCTAELAVGSYNPFIYFDF